MSLASISIIDYNIINSTKTHQYVGQGEVDDVDVGGGLHVRVGEDYHQHEDVSHHSHEEDDQVAEVQEGLASISIIDWSSIVVPGQPGGRCMLDLGHKLV